MRPIHLPIADPCHEDWDAMEPRERSRFCARCSKDVHDLSSMTEDEARAFLRERAGTRICVNYRQAPDGRLAFRSATRTVAATAIAAAALAACTPHEPPRTAPVATTRPDPVAVPEPSTPAIPLEPVPVIETKLGQVAAPMPSEPLPLRKGDTAVPNEPCDPETPEPTTALRGDIEAPR